MKRVIVLATSMLFVASLALAQNYVHLTRVIEIDNVSAAAVALSDSGDIYYGQFNGTASKLVQLDGILTGGNYNSGFATNTVSTETKTPAGRGIDDIAIDSTGNIYISGTGSGTADTILKKFGPEPTHTVLWEMGAGGLTGGEELRINGIEILDGTTLLIGKAFTTLGFKSLATGANSLADVTGGVNYQRGFAFNSSNNDIYAGKNGDSKDSSLTLWSGGTPAAPAGYAATPDLLPGTGINTPFGVATQALAYIPGDNKLVISDKVEIGARIYSITGSGAGTTFNSLQLLEGMTANEYVGITGIAANTVGGKKFIVVSGGNGTNFVIDVYVEAPSSEELWMQY